jgi:hypothetical protein
MARGMADDGFRQIQWDTRYDPHIEPVNRYVDQLRRDAERGWAPYVAPLYGGIHARPLSVSRDPGPKTVDGKGSGFPCWENDDPSAERMQAHCLSVGITADDHILWNMYPWYINSNPSTGQLEAGAVAMKGLIDLLPGLTVIVLHGGAAHRGWKKFAKRFPTLASERGLTVIETYHTANQAFWSSDPKVCEARRQHLVHALTRAAASSKAARSNSTASAILEGGSTVTSWSRSTCHTWVSPRKPHVIGSGSNRSDGQPDL